MHSFTFLWFELNNFKRQNNDNSKQFVNNKTCNKLNCLKQFLRISKMFFCLKTNFLFFTTKDGKQLRLGSWSIRSTFIIVIIRYFFDNIGYNGYIFRLYRNQCVNGKRPIFLVTRSNTRNCFLGSFQGRESKQENLFHNKAYLLIHKIIIDNVETSLQ